MKEEQKPNLNECPLDNYDLTSVYKVNGDIVSADTIEEAIEIWKRSRLLGYDSSNITKVELLYSNVKIVRR